MIQQLPTTAGDNRILLIYGKNGMKFKTSAMSIPALDPNTARDTKVILHHYGNDYYIDKIWVQGKDYGYEFPLPDRVKSRKKERRESVTVAGNYSSTQSPDMTDTNTTDTTTTTASSDQTQATQPPAMNTTTTQTTQSTDTTTPPPTVDNSANTTPPPAADTTMQQPATPPVTDNSSANRSMDNSTPAPAPAPAPVDNSSDNNSMPHTSAGWLLMLLSGGTLSGAGLSLRRKR